ncbi:uncharacterized protein CLUP02_06112 [Colletotrichum lupini]|uniref:Uncharacterized protein n=1 Tax=Colletotrichum lupini TaxID=145971 RepID=A0A9Q8SNG6_9PEZI|nr:uncharacterized protein CLUP02_06112 [Colletotrichum lupini]UQC80629.1 hypothetical protein CLUP02_06112 [Colletotrichum lupini]
MGVNASASSKVPILQTTISFPSCWACSFLPYRVPYSYLINDFAITKASRFLTKIYNNLSTSSKHAEYHIDMPGVFSFSSRPPISYFKFSGHAFFTWSPPPLASSRLFACICGTNASPSAHRRIVASALQLWWMLIPSIFFVAFAAGHQLRVLRLSCVAFEHTNSLSLSSRLIFGTASVASFFFPPSPVAFSTQTLPACSLAPLLRYAVCSQDGRASSISQSKGKPELRVTRPSNIDPIDWSRAAGHSSGQYEHTNRIGHHLPSSPERTTQLDGPVQGAKTGDNTKQGSVP